jgi:hypothetical protein
MHHKDSDAKEIVPPQRRDSSLPARHLSALRVALNDFRTPLPMAYTHGHGFSHFLRIKKELVAASPNIRSNGEPRSLSKWTLMSTTARWAEPTACLNGRTGPFVRSGPWFSRALRSVAVPLLPRI